MATVSIVQSATASSALATTLTVTLPSAPTGGDFVCVAVSASQPIATISAGGTLLGGSPGAPVLLVYRYVGVQSVNVTFATAAVVGLFIFELSSACISTPVNTVGTAVTAPSLTASLPSNWLTTVGDLPLAFFTSAAPATATAQSGWTTLATLNTAAGNVLNVQSGPVATSARQPYTGMVTWSATNPAGEAIVLAANQAFYDFTSQGVIETIDFGTPLARSSQEMLEAIGQDTATGRASQETAEVVGQDTALARGSQIYIELIVPLYERTSQMVGEVLGSNAPNVRSSQMVAEVLFSSQGQRRRTVDEEWTTI